MIDFVDNITPVNRYRLMAIQGFEPLTIIFNDDGSITETNKEGQKKITTFPSNGNIIEKFIGEKTITMETIFESNGNITQNVY